MANSFNDKCGIEVVNKRKETETSFDVKHKKFKSSDMNIEKNSKINNIEKMKNKCEKCRRKLNLVGAYDCRCGNMYCSRHRFYDQHECTFDFKSLALEKLREENPKLKSRRIGD